MRAQHSVQVVPSLHNTRRISFLPAAFSTSGRIDAEFLRLLFRHAHRESEEFFKLTPPLSLTERSAVGSPQTSLLEILRSLVKMVAWSRCPWEG